MTIIRPNWLEVENAMIFLMSFCVKAQIAVKRVVIAPRHSMVDIISLLVSRRG